MEMIFCDGCGEQITKGSISVAPLTILSENGSGSADIEGDYCEDCAEMVAETVRAVFSAEESDE